MPSTILHAGPLTARYSEGSLRGISVDGREVLRHVLVALRDHSWKTIPYRLTRENVMKLDDRFRIELTAKHVTDEVDFVWDGFIEGHADGRIVWRMSGEARRPFSRNRIGFCALHPIALCAGIPCLVEHPDGKKEHLRFPYHIAPHQPFVDMRAMSYEVRPGLMADIRFSGDVFETEDHRNWTDYSFKTYSTALHLPRPVVVRPGERIEQTVELTLRETSPSIQVDWVNKLKAPDLETRRIDVHFDGPVAILNADGPLEVAFFTDDPEKDLPPLIPQLSRLNVRRYLIFSASGTITTLAAVTQARRVLGEGVPIGGGSNTHFVELNRHREAIASLDFLSWPVYPRAHAEDPETIIENLEGAQATLESARVLAPEKPLRISQVHVPPIPAAEGWLAASLSRLGQAGAESIVSEPHPLIDEINAFGPEHLLHVWSSDPLKFYALVLQARGETRAWLANFTDQPQTIQFEGTELALPAYSCIRKVF